MNLKKRHTSMKGLAVVVSVAALAALAAPFLPTVLSSVVAQTETAADPAGLALAPQAGRPVTVELTQAVSRTITQTRTVAGRVEPARTVDIAFQIPGQIVHLAVQSGDRVRNGDIIAELDRVDFELALDRAQASYNLANSELQRAADLAERGVAADARLETAQAQFAQAQVQLRQAERRLSQVRILAPFDAIVARTFVEEFVNTTTAAPVARLQDLSEMRVVISLPEELAAIARATPDAFDITASFPAVPGYTVSLELRSFSTDADPTTQTYDLEFAITGEIDPRLLPGMTADVGIAVSADADTGQAVVIPVSAVDTTSRSEPSVWVYNEASRKVTRRTVRLGLPFENDIVVLDGLEGDELVVSGGWWRLSESQSVIAAGL